MQRITLQQHRLLRRIGGNRELSDRLRDLSDRIGDGVVLSPRMLTIYNQVVILQFSPEMPRPIRGWPLACSQPNHDTLPLIGGCWAGGDRRSLPKRDQRSRAH